jgi:hypothetical protein
LKVDERIKEWLQKLDETKSPVEVVSFFQELPIRVKTKLLDYDKNFVRWEPNPKLLLAVGDSKNIFFRFYDPFFKQERLLKGNVTYYCNSFIETDIPTLSADPRFEGVTVKREHVRVAVPPRDEVKCFICSKEKKSPIKVKDISECGLGITAQLDTLKLGEVLDLELILPTGKLSLKGEVVSKESLGKSGDKYGIKLQVNRVVGEQYGNTSWPDKGKFYQR